MWSDSGSHRGYGVAYLPSAWLERGAKKGGGVSVFTFDSMLRVVSTVGHWSVMGISQGA